MYLYPMTLLDVTFTDQYGQLQHVEVCQPCGGGGNSWSVNVNQYFKGQIVYYYTGWQSFVSTPVLDGNDIRVIMDLISEI